MTKMTTNTPRMMLTSLMLPARMQTAKLNPAQANIDLGMTYQKMPANLMLPHAKLNPTPCILARRMHYQRTKLPSMTRLHAGMEMPTAKLNTAEASLTTRMTCQLTRLSSRLHTPK